jgi:hypothetical protein
MSAPLSQKIVPILSSALTDRKTAGSFRISSNMGPCRYFSRSVSREDPSVNPMRTRNPSSTATDRMRTGRSVFIYYPLLFKWFDLRQPRAIAGSFPIRHQFRSMFIGPFNNHGVGSTLDVAGKSPKCLDINENLASRVLCMEVRRK